MSKLFEKNKKFVSECVRWFVHNGVPVEKISIEVTPLNYVVLYGSRGVTRRPLMQILHRTRCAGETSRNERAQSAFNRYSKVLEVVKSEPVEPWVFKEENK